MLGWHPSVCRMNEWVGVESGMLRKSMGQCVPKNKEASLERPKQNLQGNTSRDGLQGVKLSQ